MLTLHVSILFHLLHLRTVAWRQCTSLLLTRTHVQILGSQTVGLASDRALCVEIHAPPLESEVSWTRCLQGKRTSGHYRQVFAGFRQIGEHLVPSILVTWSVVVQTKTRRDLYVLGSCELMAQTTHNPFRLITDVVAWGYRHC